MKDIPATACEPAACIKCERPCGSLVGDERGKAAMASRGARRQLIKHMTGSEQGECASSGPASGHGTRRTWGRASVTRGTEGRKRMSRSPWPEMDGMAEASERRAEGLVWVVEGRCRSEREGEGGPTGVDVASGSSLLGLSPQGSQPATRSPPFAAQADAVSPPLETRCRGSPLLPGYTSKHPS